MSKLALESFVTYKTASDGEGFDFYPEPREVVRQGKNAVVTLGDVPLPPGIPAAKNALTVLYGFRDALDELKSQYARARRYGMQVAKVSFHLDVDEIVMGTTNPDSIGSTRFLNLRRLSRDLQQVIIDNVNELAAKERNANPVLFERMTEAGQRPDLICQAIRAEAVFKHINSVVYMVPDGTPRGRQVATIFTTNVTDFEVRGDVPFQIKLPKL
jgi:hypothetical protein